MIPIPHDPAVIGIVVIALALLVRELLALVRAQAEKREAEKREAEKAKDSERENTLGKLEAKIDSLAIDVRANLRELSTTQAQHQADLAVANQRITTLEIEVKGLREAELGRARPERTA